MPQRDGCTYACFDSACNRTVCDDVIKDGAGKTELTRCYASASLDAACGARTSDGAAVGGTYDACTTDPAFTAATQNCRFSSTSATPIAKQVEYFFRGACRDGGNWASATTVPDGG